MSGRIRRRMSGSLRRGSLENLVRTRSSIGKVPPTPINGSIYRPMRPELISDYEGISTASWSTGTTAGSTAGSFNCFYYHYTTPNARTTDQEFIMQPVRWTISVPDTNGGDFDFVWRNTSPTQFFRSYPLPSVGSQTIAGFLGRVGVSEKLLAVNSHAVFPSSFFQLLRAPIWAGVGVNPSGTPSFNASALQAIDPTVRVWNSTTGGYNFGGADNLGFATFYAARHWVNGSPVDAVRYSLPNFNTGSAKWQVEINPGDTYHIDVWYKVRSTASVLNPAATPAKACVYIPTSYVIGGDERANTEYCQFGNVDFSPKFSSVRHAYAVTVDGHTGWTLKDGTNGPHTMQTGGGWTFSNLSSSGFFSGGNLTWVKDVNDSYVRAIVLRFDREIAHVEFYPGPLMGTPSSLACVYYRVDEGGTEYRKETLSTDYGTLYHASPGLFNQAGASEFKLVPWATDVSNTGYSPTTEGGAFGASSVATGTTRSALPTSITMRRV